MKKLAYLILVISLVCIAEDSVKPSVSPEEAQKVFITEARQLTFVGPRSGEGYFSADGKMMIYQSERSAQNPFYQMYVLNLETGKSSRISPGYGQTTCGWIHPNLKKALWSSTHLDPKWQQVQKKELEERKNPLKKRYSWVFDPAYDIFESDLHGKNLKRLTKAPGYDAEASYSSDGKWIAFASNRTGYEKGLSQEEADLFQKDPSSQMEIYIMRADGSQVRRLTRALGYDGGPFFSQDGKKITWRRFSADGAKAEIWTMNADGSEQTQITRLNKLSWAPYFHPSGDYVVFASNIEGHSNFELYIVDSLGKKDPVRVTFQDGFDGLATFSPDGTKISWTRRNEKGESQIYMASWNDEAARKALGLKPKTLAPLSLSPDIRTSDLQSWINYLASPEMQGRRTGSAEEKIYTAKIAELFKSWGLVPAKGFKDFFHEFEFVSGVRFGENNTLTITPTTSKALNLSVDFEPLSISKTGSFQNANVVFAGYGLRTPVTEKIAAYNSYEGLDVKGKWVLVLQDVPQDVPQETRNHYNQYARLEYKATMAKGEGALGLIVMVGPRTPFVDTWGKLRLEGNPLESGIAVIKIHPNLGKSLFQKAGHNIESLQAQLDSGKAVAGFEFQDLQVQAQVDLKVEKSTGRNVVGRLKAPRGQSAILMAAHGDHLGLGEMGSTLATSADHDPVHYGADDNASGMSVVLELAHYWSKAPLAQRRSVNRDLYFALWSGEEMGLLGSKAWIHDWKKQNGSLNKTFGAYINFDMVGRLRDKLILQGSGSSSTWPSILEELSVRTQLPINTQMDPYLPTDSMAFYIEKLPTLNFFTGAHSEYHTPRDTPDTINYKGLLQVAQFAQQLSVEIGKVSKPLPFVDIPQSSKGQTLGKRSFRIFLGTIPDYSQDGIKGVRLSGVSKNSPAEKGGLKAQDVIVELAGQKVENLYDYTYALQNLKPGAEVLVKVLRTGAPQAIKIIPALKE